MVDTAATHAWAGGKAEGIAIGREEGLTEGELKGELKAKREMARQFKQDAMALAWICKYTGLSPEEFDEL